MTYSDIIILVPSANNLVASFFPFIQNNTFKNVFLTCSFLPAIRLLDFIEPVVSDNG